MKKTIFISVFMLFARVVFTQQFETVYTSEGTYFVSILSDARRDVDSLLRSRGYISLTKLTNGQWECVRRALSRYQGQTTRGDRYFIHIMTVEINGFWTNIFVFCDFTSNAQYQWQAYSKITNGGDFAR